MVGANRCPSKICESRMEFPQSAGTILNHHDRGEIQSTPWLFFVKISETRTKHALCQACRFSLTSREAKGTLEASLYVFSDLKTSSGTHLLYQDPSLSILVTTSSRFSPGKPNILFASLSSLAKSFPNPTRHSRSRGQLVQCLPHLALCQ
jgi:hypothetical protein